MRAWSAEGRQPGGRELRWGLQFSPSCPSSLRFACRQKSFSMNRMTFFKLSSPSASSLLIISVFYPKVRRKGRGKYNSEKLGSCSFTSLMEKEL